MHDVSAAWISLMSWTEPANFDLWYVTYDLIWAPAVLFIYLIISAIQCVFWFCLRPVGGSKQRGFSIRVEFRQCSFCMNEHVFCFHSFVAHVCVFCCCRLWKLNLTLFKSADIFQFIHFTQLLLLMRDPEKRYIMISVSTLNQAELSLQITFHPKNVFWWLLD